MAYETAAAPGGVELTEVAVARAGLKPPSRILDVGCGGGAAVRWLRGHGFNAFGVDRCGAGFGLDLPLVQAQAGRLPFASASLSAVLAACSLSLADSPDAVLAEWARVVEPGGRLLVTDVYARVPEAIGAVRALSGTGAAGIIVRAELEHRLAAAGFEICLWEDHSDVLGAYVARCIWEHGSADCLWPCNVAPVVRHVRPGYFLLVARAQRGESDGR